MPVFVPVKEWLADREEEAKRRLDQTISGVQQAGQQIVQTGQDTIQAAADEAQRKKEEFAQSLLQEQFDRIRQQTEEAMRNARPQPPAEPAPESEVSTPSTAVPPPATPVTRESEPPVSEVGPIIERNTAPPPQPTPEPPPIPEAQPEPEPEVQAQQFSLPLSPQPQAPPTPPQFKVPGMPGQDGLAGIKNQIGQTFSDIGSQARAKLDEAVPDTFDPTMGLGKPIEVGRRENEFDPAKALGVDNIQVSGEFNPKIPELPEVDRDAPGPLRVAREFGESAIESANRMTDPQERLKLGAGVGDVLSYLPGSVDGRGGAAFGPQLEDETDRANRFRERAKTGEDVEDLATTMQGIGDVGNLAPFPAEQVENALATTVIEALRDVPIPEQAKAGLAIIAGTGVPTAIGKRFVVPGAKKAAGAVADVARDLNANQLGILGGDSASIPSDPNYVYRGVTDEELRSLSKGDLPADSQVRNEPTMASADMGYDVAGVRPGDRTAVVRIHRDDLPHGSTLDREGASYTRDDLPNTAIQVRGDDGQWHPAAGFTERWDYGIPSREMGGRPEDDYPLRASDLPKPPPPAPTWITGQELNPGEIAERAKRRRDWATDSGIDTRDLTDDDIANMPAEDWMRETGRRRGQPPTSPPNDMRASDLPQEPIPPGGRPDDDFSDLQRRYEEWESDQARGSGPPSQETPPSEPSGAASLGQWRRQHLIDAGVDPEKIRDIRDEDLGDLDFQGWNDYADWAQGTGAYRRPEGPKPPPTNPIPEDQLLPERPEGGFPWRVDDDPDVPSGRDTIGSGPPFPAPGANRRARLTEWGIDHSKYDDDFLDEMTADEFDVFVNRNLPGGRGVGLTPEDAEDALRNRPPSPTGEPGGLEGRRLDWNEQAFLDKGRDRRADAIRDGFDEGDLVDLDDDAIGRMSEDDWDEWQTRREQEIADHFRNGGTAENWSPGGPKLPPDPRRLLDEAKPLRPGDVPPSSPNTIPTGEQLARSDDIGDVGRRKGMQNFIPGSAVENALDSMEGDWFRTARTGREAAFDLASGAAGATGGVLTADEDATLGEKAGRALTGFALGSSAGPRARAVRRRIGSGSAGRGLRNFLADETGSLNITPGGAAVPDWKQQELDEIAKRGLKEAPTSREFGDRTQYVRFPSDKQIGPAITAREYQALVSRRQRVAKVARDAATADPADVDKADFADAMEQGRDLAIQDYRTRLRASGGDEWNVQLALEAVARRRRAWEQANGVQPAGQAPVPTPTPPTTPTTTPPTATPPTTTGPPTTTTTPPTTPPTTTTSPPTTTTTPAPPTPPPPGPRGGSPGPTNPLLPSGPNAAPKTPDPITKLEMSDAYRYSVGLLANPVNAAADYSMGRAEAPWQFLRNQLMHVADPNRRAIMEAQMRGERLGADLGKQNFIKVWQTGIDLDELMPGAQPADLQKSLMRRADLRGETDLSKRLGKVEAFSRTRNALDALNHGRLYGAELYRQAALAANDVAKTQGGSAPGTPGWWQEVEGFVRDAADPNLAATDPIYAARKTAIDLADKGLGRNDPGFFGNQISKVFQWAPMKPFFPLFKTGYNINVRGMERTPLGYVGILYDTAMEKGTGTNRGITKERWTDAHMGTAALASTLPLILHHDITGYGPKDEKTREDLMAQGWRPYSVRLPDGRYVSYRRFGQFAAPFALAGAISDAIAFKSPDEPAGMVVLDASENFSRWFGDQFVLRSVGDLQRMSTNLGKEVPSWAGRLFTQYSTGAAPSAIAAALDPYQRDVESDDIVETFTNQLKYGWPLARNDLPIKYDTFGDPLPNPNYGIGSLNPFTAGPATGDLNPETADLRRWRAGESAAEDTRIDQALEMTEDMYSGLPQEPPGDETMDLVGKSYGGENDAYFRRKDEAKAAEEARKNERALARVGG